MLEIEKLEKEWRKYKIKQLKPYVFISILLALSAIFLTLYSKDATKLVQQIAFNDEGAKKEVAVDEKEMSKESTEATESETKSYSSQTPSSNTSEEKTAKIAEDKTEIDLDSRDSKKEEKEVDSLALKADTGFLETFAPQSTPVSSKASNSPKKAIQPVQRPTTDTSNRFAQEMKDETKTENTVDSERAVKEHNSLVLTTTKTNNTLEYLIKRFNEKRDPKLASYISRSYYKKGKYKEALKWSIEANSLDPSNEESWILFAKANVKLGNREDAIQALKVYLNQYSSRNVKSLLNSLESK